MSKTIQKDRNFVILNSKQKITDSSFKSFKKLINERSKGKPIAHIVGNKDFWKYNFIISKDILIPRPDTELIIEEVLKLTKHKKKLSILDVGIGCGCILLSILKEKKDFYGIGIDKSKKCLEISKINSSRLGLINRSKFFKSDIDNFSQGKYDLIISNPPYIKKLDLKYLERDVINFEPKLALDGGLDGISEIRKVIKRSSGLIKINGKLVLEIAFDQKKEVVNLLKQKGFYINKVVKDLTGNDRCVISTKLK
tara:strand:- start:1102 stop:1860 length:759 start_codon:yes stop_codon:yes gene_type:complete